MLIDGEQAAIEVAHAWPHPRGNAAHRATATGQLVRDRLQAGRPGMNLYVWGEFDIDAILRRPPGIAEQEANHLAAAIIDVADRGVGFATPVNPDQLPAWLDVVRVTRWKRDALGDAAGARPSQTVYLLARSDRPRHVADLRRFVVDVKAPRVARWGLGIVVLIAGASDLAGDLAAEMATLAAAPLWRLYWLGGGEGRLIWSRPA